MPSFGSLGTSSGGGNGTACTVPVPPSVAAGHIIMVPMYVETGKTVTGPSGAGVWAEAPNSPVLVTGTHAHDLHILWKRATAADTGNYDFVVQAGLAWRLGFALRFTDCVAHGNPWDVTAAAIKTTTTTGATPSVSLTTKGQDRLLVWAGSYFNGDATCTPPSGWTERADISGGVAVDVATLNQPLAGASAGLIGTFSGNGGTGAWAGALLPSASKFLAAL